ncbi:recombinase family protein [Eubacterium barkeri]|uniref:Site-specific DNA recombinase n=1 Tax=Eubacterium barkeri TaxID=1528 RepID=A0A1H3G7A1_EUBBA|nr:recombinase family protein [Eubacterium barkeri]SDX99131.1 Site-specific DNA recombinase [Eubacterium barkeri]
MERIGYIRVSTEEQNETRQEVIMEQLDASKVFIEKLSGKDTNRPQLKAMLNYVREGDTVVVESYSRLARSTKDLLNIVDELSSKGVQFISQKENIDTTTPQGRLMLTIFAGLAQFERECMLERQREGIAIAKAEGKYKGRQPIAIDQEQFKTVYKNWKDGNITARNAMEELGLKPNTFYRRVKEYEVQQECN